MKRLTIYTQSYEQALRAFAAEASGQGRLILQYEGRRDGLYYMHCTCETDAALMDAFAALLEHVAIQANPVYRHSVKLAELAADLRSTPIHAENTRRLAAFLKHNTSMHLEGYAAFRMRTFKEKLDMMTYTLIKKIRLSER